MAYLYRHIRLDTNEPFYVGIGSDNKGKFSRANQIKRRSLRWKDIGKKVPIRVEIVLDDLTWEEACEKEIFFIALYGRTDKGLGPLVNMTDGGQTGYGKIVSEETKLKKNKALKEYYKTHYHISKGKSKSKEFKENLINDKERGEKISKTKIGTLFTKEHCNNISKGKIGVKQSKETCEKRSKSLKGKSKPIGTGSKISKSKKGKNLIPVIQKDLNGNFIKEWPSQLEASKTLKIWGSAISYCCTGKYKTAGGFIWEYKFKK